jgi:hypothetical protein
MGRKNNNPITYFNRNGVSKLGIRKGARMSLLMIFIGLTIGNVIYGIIFDKMEDAIDRTFFQFVALACVYFLA